MDSKVRTLCTLHVSVVDSRSESVGGGGGGRGCC